MNEAAGSRTSPRDGRSRSGQTGRVPRRHPARCHLLILATALLASGCAKTSQTPLMQDMSPKDLSRQELRARLYDLVGHHNALVVSNAEFMDRASNDPQLRLATLTWRMFATGEMLAAAFRIDPLLGMADAWALSIQLRMAFEQGGLLGDVFGDYQHLAREAHAEVERLFRNLADVALSDPVGPDRSLHAWAEANPVGSLTRGRTSLLETSQNDTVMSGYRTSAFGVDEMQSTIEDLNERAPLLVENGIRQAVWRLEAIFLDKDIDGSLDAIVTDLGDINVSADRIAVGVDSVLALVDGVDSLVQVLQSERAIVLRDVDRQRVATLDALSAERAAVLEALDLQLARIIDVLRDERSIVMAEADEITDGKIELATVGLESIVDKVFWRAVQLLLMAAVLVLVVGWVLVRSRARTGIMIRRETDDAG